MPLHAMVMSLRRPVNSPLALLPSLRCSSIIKDDSVVPSFCIIASKVTKGAQSTILALINIGFFQVWVLISSRSRFSGDNAFERALRRCMN